MKRLLRNVSAATRVDNTIKAESNETVDVNKLMKLLSQVKQLQGHKIIAIPQNAGNLILKIDGIFYETTDYE